MGTRRETYRNVHYDGTPVSAATLLYETRSSRAWVLVVARRKEDVERLRRLPRELQDVGGSLGHFEKKRWVEHVSVLEAGEEGEESSEAMADEDVLFSHLFDWLPEEGADSRLHELGVRACGLADECVTCERDSCRSCKAFRNVAERFGCYCF